MGLRLVYFNTVFFKTQALTDLTAVQLAEMVGRSHNFIRQIESEKVHYNFSVETFENG